MRAKRPYIVLSFRTTVEAMAWEKHCEAEHIPGCGLAWRMPPEDWQLWQSRIDPAAYDAAAVVEQ